MWMGVGTILLSPPHLHCFQDLAMYINEVKRDKETLKKISEFQSSIENLVSVAGSYRVEVMTVYTHLRNYFHRLDIP